MVYFAFALAITAGMAATVTLVLQGHPWFAALVLLVTSGLSMTGRR